MYNIIPGGAVGIDDDAGCLKKMKKSELNIFYERHLGAIGIKSLIAWHDSSFDQSNYHTLRLHCIVDVKISFIFGKITNREYEEKHIILFLKGAWTSMISQYEEHSQNWWTV